MTRKILSLQINPKNGTIVALCDDGSVWLRDGSLANSAAPWKPVNDEPINPTSTPTKENEDDITIAV